VLSEAFAYRNHPLTARMKHIVGNELGVIQHIEARFRFLLPNFSNVRYQYDLAGGALMDAGCYPVSMVRFLMGAEPKVVKAKARLYKPQVDSGMEANFEFPNGSTGRILCDMLSPRLFDSFLHVKGDAGEMKVLSPFQPHVFHWMTVHTSNETCREHVRGGNSYALQLHNFVKAIRGEISLNTNPEDAVKTMRVIDSIYEKAGLKLRGT
jgi:predicted dehydrogenase